MENSLYSYIQEPFCEIMESMNKSVDVSIIYVNYNTQALIEDSLNSVIKNLHGFRYEVIVVDNASNSFDKTALKKIYPQVKILIQDKNLGFGGGNNAGAAIANGKYLWLLNTDTLIPKDNELHLIHDFLENHTGYAAASPLLVNKKGEYQSSQIAYFPGVTRMVSEKPLKFIVRVLPATRILFKSVNADYLPLEARDIDSAAAAAFFIRHTIFEEVGGFSKQYFMYYEDTDLCKKIASDGYKIRFVPEAKVVHLLGQSIRSSYERKKMYFKSQDIYFAYWQSRISQLGVKILRLPLVFLYWLRRGSI